MLRLGIRCAVIDLGAGYCIMQVSFKVEYILRGRVKFPTGGKAKRRPSPRPDDATGIVRHGGSGVIPEPTVIVWMGEGKQTDRVPLDACPTFCGVFC